MSDLLKDWRKRAEAEDPGQPPAINRFNADERTGIGPVDSLLALVSPTKFNAPKPLPEDATAPAEPRPVTVYDETDPRSALKPRVGGYPEDVGSVPIEPTVPVEVYAVDDPRSRLHPKPGGYPEMDEAAVEDFIKKMAAQMRGVGGAGGGGGSAPRPASAPPRAPPVAHDAPPSDTKYPDLARLGRQRKR